jgi:hypothetical protein
MKHKEKLKLEINKLEKTLAAVEKPVISGERKQLMKSRLLKKIDAPVADYVSSFAEVFVLDAVTKAAIKEKVFAVIERQRSSRFVLGGLLSFSKKFASTALVMILSFFGVFSFLGSGNVVMAETFTILDDFNGEVWVKRGSVVMSAEPGMRIYEKDKVITGEDSLATVKYFDDSVSRLSENTELNINKLFRPSGSSVKSYVEVSLEDGVLWSKVVNLVERNSLFVVEASDVYSSTQRGAFNIEIDQEEKKVELDVYKNVVDLRSGGSVSKVMSGEKAVVDSSKSVIVVDLDEMERSDEWVKKNIESDEVHIADVEERIMLSKVAVAEANNGDIRNQTQLFLTFDDVEKKKLKLELSEKKFVELQLKLEGGVEISEDELGEFAHDVEVFYELIDEVKLRDEKYAAELNLYVEDKILKQKKNLSLVLPDSPVYKAKKVIGELEVMFAGETSDLVQVKADQAMVKISDGESVILKGDKKLGEQIISEAKSDIEETIDLLEGSEELNVDVKQLLADNVITVMTAAEDVNSVEEVEETGDDKILPPLLGDIN